MWSWSGTHGGATDDQIHVIGNILSGIGFLGAGIIVQSGLNVRGLTTAATVLGSSAIGILVGTGFHAAAIGLAALFIFSFAVVPNVERHLPARSTFAVTLRFRIAFRLNEDRLRRYLAHRGASLVRDSLVITHDDNLFEIQF